MWLPVLYVRWVFWLMVGILWELWGDGHRWIGELFFLVCVALYASAHFALPARWRVRYHWLLGVTSALVLVSFGVTRTYSLTERYAPQHFLHAQGVDAYSVQIVQEPQHKSRNIRAVGEVRRVRAAGKWQARQGKVLLYFRQEENKSLAPQYGDEFVVLGCPQKVPPSPNPAAFDFSQYLARQQVYHQQFLSPSEVVKIGHSIPDYPLYFANFLRRQCIATFEKYVEGARESALATALVLGVKDDVDSEVLDAYTVTGLMHVLAVSGMHIGLLVWLPMLWFERLKHDKSPRKKLKRWVFLVSMWFFLGFYALLTGLSASIVRAALMFSVLLVGKVLHKRGNNYNILAFSALVLLIWNPFWVLDVGFQLSYLAVAGIFYFQPRLARLYTPKNRIIQEIWSVVTVTLAAQIATTPISLFYFHQFPNYFLLSNLLVVPLSTFVLYTVLALLLVSWIPYVGVAVGWLASTGIWLTNVIVFWLQSLPMQLSNGIWLEWWEVACMYGFIVAFSLTWEARRWRYWLYTCLFLAGLTGSRMVRYLLQNTQQAVVVYQLGKIDNFVLFAGHHAYMSGDSVALRDQKLFNFAMRNHFYQRGVVFPTFTQDSDGTHTPFAATVTPLYRYVQFAGKRFIILPQKLTKKELMTLAGLEADYCILQNRAFFSLKDVLPFLRIKHLVLGASMPASYEKNLRKEAKEADISFYSMRTSGAFVLDLK